MRHRKSGRQLNRNSSHRKSMFKNMAASLFEHEVIKTTVPKAKEVRRLVERCITIAKKGLQAEEEARIHALQNATSAAEMRAILAGGRSIARAPTAS